MNDLMKWLALWEKCPELAVRDLYYEPSLVMGSWYKSLCGRQLSRAELFDNKNWNAVHTDDAAALIRDRAVWWLGTKRAYLRPNGGQWGGSGLWIVKYIDEWLPLGSHDDPTEALRIGCCSVLGVEP